MSRKAKPVGLPRWKRLEEECETLRVQNTNMKHMMCLMLQELRWQCDELLAEDIGPDKYSRLNNVMKTLEVFSE